MRPDVHSSTIYNSQAWKQPSYLPRDGWLKITHTHTQTHTHTHTNITQNEIQPFAEMWMDLENIMLSEMSGR